MLGAHGRGSQRITCRRVSISNDPFRTPIIVYCFILKRKGVIKHGMNRIIADAQRGVKGGAGLGMGTTKVHCVVHPDLSLGRVS